MSYTSNRNLTDRACQVKSDKKRLKKNLKKLASVRGSVTIQP